MYCLLLTKPTANPLFRYFIYFKILLINGTTKQGLHQGYSAKLFDLILTWDLLWAPTDIKGMFSVVGWLLLLIFLRDPTLKRPMRGQLYLFRQATTNSSKLFNFFMKACQEPGGELKTRSREELI